MSAATSDGVRVFVGVDGSAASAKALQAGARLAGSIGTTVVAVHAWQPPPEVATRDEHLAALEERTTLVERGWVRPNVGDIEFTVEVQRCDPRDVAYIAHEAGAGILVLGRTGESGGPGFLHLGSVVEHAAHHSEIPLAVIPEDADGAMDRITIGVDGSDKSAAAISWCVDAGLAEGADVAAVLVDRSHTDTDRLRRDVMSWTQALTEAGARVEPVIRNEKHAADGLLAAIVDSDSDLVIVATRGRNGFLGLRIGGVALKVLHGIDRPLILVPPRPSRRRGQVT